MFKPKWMLLLGCMSLVACTSTPPETLSAAEKTSEPATAAPATVAVVKSYTKDTDKNAVLCRKEKVLGSNRSVKVCKTIAQQNEERKQAEQMVNDRSLQQSLGGGG
ncbi:MAG: hypothetical protein U5L02_04175 [Rheinheimera sp.]|nr:hypothetical protein [Rheinheimera sp.]